MAQRITDLDTPALLLDGPASQRNLDRMAALFRGTPRALRPHFKNHKCPQLARRQIESGAVGITCAKLGEAEVLAARGFTDLLVANQVVGAEKMRRLAAVARRASIAVAVDDDTQIAMLSEAATATGVTIGVLVEIDNGNGRCGAREPAEGVRLARLVVKSPGLRFEGIQAYEGQATYVDDVGERRAMLAEAVARNLEFRAAMERDGQRVAKIGGGSSATAEMLVETGGVDEVQAGTYATMDWRYNQLTPEYEIALSVLARVISRGGDAGGDRTILDVGTKGLGLEFGPARVKGRAELGVKANEEHAIVTGPLDVGVGGLVELVPSHACTTCNLHREMVVHDGQGTVVDRWSIEASGALR